MPSMKDIIKESFLKHLMLSLAKSPEHASNLDRYQALALSIRDLMVERWIATKDTYELKQPRTVYYISLEFLMGRTLGNAMINLGVYDAAVEALKELGLKLERLRDEEGTAIRSRSRITGSAAATPGRSAVRNLRAPFSSAGGSSLIRTPGTRTAAAGSIRRRFWRCRMIRRFPATARTL